MSRGAWGVDGRGYFFCVFFSSFRLRLLLLLLLPLLLVVWLLPGPFRYPKKKCDLLLQ